MAVSFSGNIVPLTDSTKTWKPALRFGEDRFEHLTNGDKRAILKRREAAKQDLALPDWESVQAMDEVLLPVLDQLSDYKPPKYKEFLADYMDAIGKLPLHFGLLGPLVDLFEPLYRITTPEPAHHYIAQAEIQGQKIAAFPVKAVRDRIIDALSRHNNAHARAVAAFAALEVYKREVDTTFPPDKPLDEKG